MVNIPGSSKRCKECRLRRVKCGLEQPSCARCLKSGIDCSGPRTGAIFVQRDIVNIYGESDRKLLHRSVRNQSSGAVGHARGPKQRPYKDNSVPTPHAPLVSVPTVGCHPHIYRSLVDDFWYSTRSSPKDTAMQNIHSPVSFGTLIVSPEAFSNEALGNAIFAVSALYIGTRKGDTKLLRLAMVAYPGALRRFRSEIDSAFDPKAAQEPGFESVMAIVLSLLVFELLSNGPDCEGFHHHLNGALDLIKLYGTERLQSSTAKEIYTMIRSMALAEALRNRKATFLAADSWVSVPRQLAVKSAQELLLDSTLHVPGFLELADQIKLFWLMEEDNIEAGKEIKSSNSHISRCSHALLFLQDCDALRQQLHDWLGFLQGSQKETLWWYSQTSGLGYELSPNISCQNLISEIEGVPNPLGPMIHFSSAGIPELLIYYWTALLELSTAAIEISNLLRQDSAKETVAEGRTFYNPPISGDENSPDELALRICQTAMHLSSSLEGCTIAYVPARLAENHFLRSLSSGCEPPHEDDFRLGIAQINLDFCRGVLQTLQKWS